MNSKDPTPGESGMRSLSSPSPSGHTDVWTMFADVTQRLQVSSASIKAAISSLLDNSIIWDRSAQREFMQTIDKSIDHISGVMVAMTLAMQSESGVLRFGLEPSSIPEIIFRVVDRLEKSTPGLVITLTLPGEGKLALVDYDYLRVTLKMLLEALISAGPTSSNALHIRAEETTVDWQIHVEGDFTGAATELIAWLGAGETAGPLPVTSGTYIEARLKVFTAARLLRQQRIKLSAPRTPASADLPSSFTLKIPLSEARWKSAESF